MKNKYRFRHQPGRAIQVMFAHIPGKWISTGTEDMTKAVLWAENRLNEDMGIAVDKTMTLERFAKDFFTESFVKLVKRLMHCHDRHLSGAVP